MTQIVALASCMAITACSTLTSLSIPGEPSKGYIDGLLKNHQFNTALQAVDKWQVLYPENGELPEQRKQIIRAINRFESSALKKAQQLDADGQWQAARQACESVLAKLPASQSLQNAYSDFSARHFAHLNALKESIEVAQAKHWLEINDDIEAMYEAASNDNEARAWQSKRDSERELLGRRLVNYGLAHEEKEHFGTAALRYDLAYRIAPGEFTKPYHE